MNTSSSWLATHTAFYDTGMPYRVTDPAGHTTTYTYSTAYAGAYLTQTQDPDTIAGGATVHHIVSGAYDFNTGVLTSYTDQNQQTTAYTYDPLNRLASAASGGWSVGELYDRYGNRVQQTGSFGPVLTFSGNDNRMDPGTPGYAYNAAGDMTFDGANTYCYDAEGRVLTVVPGAGGDCSTSAPLANYYYDAEGNRVEKQVGGAVTDDAWWQGTLLARRTGALADADWSDYIYAGGRRIARADTFENRLSISGTICSTCSGWSIYELDGTNQWWSNYVVQSGDTLWLEQNQGSAGGGAYGGLKLFFFGGADTNWQATDQNGQYLNDDHNDSGWHLRKVDLSQWAGQTLNAIDLVQEGDSTPGNFDIVFKDIVLVSANGTVRPIYTGQPTVAITGAGGSAGITRNWGIEHGVDLGGDGDLTHWYHTDQVGTTRLITSHWGVPVWQGTFLPFGEELNPQPDVSDQKFTGKPRDPETGLDDFGARYNSSDFGRFMTPDWAAGAEAVPYAGLDNPQSLNLYAYALNNPVTRVDFDGHFDGPGNDPTPKCPEGGNCDADPTAPPIQETAPPAPNWQYSQKTGSMDLKVGDKKVVHAGTGYSGHGKGLNNPASQSVSERQDKANAGPLPRGKYTIGPPFNNRGSTGPFSLRLAPDPGNAMHGRGSFLIHGPEVHERMGIDPPVSSEGCPILPRSSREVVAASGVTLLEVVQ